MTGDKVVIKFLLLIHLVLASENYYCSYNKQTVAIKTCSFFDHIKPLRYQVYVDPCINDGNFSGYVHIDLVISRPTKNISLHSQELEFCDEGVYLTPKGPTNDTLGSLKSIKDFENLENSSLDLDEMETVRPCKFIYRKEHQIVTMKFEQVLKPGRYTLEINYMGTINSEPIGLHRQFYKNENGNNETILLTKLFPTSARRVFPCHDDPRVKAEIHFTIQTSLNFTTLTAKTPKTSVEFKEGQQWSYIHPVSNISTYQLNFAVLKKMSNLTISNLNKTFIFYGLENELKESNLTQNTYMKALNVIENVTKINYPLDTLIAFIIPREINNSQSLSLGFLSIDSLTKSYVEMKYEYVNKRFALFHATADIVAQWFQNIISPVSWKHMWFTDGLTHYFKYYVVNEIMPIWRVFDAFPVWEMQRSPLQSRNKFVVTPRLNENIEDSPEGIQCLIKNSRYKSQVGSTLMRMMTHFLNKDIFFSGITNLLKNKKYKSVEPEDLWESIQNIIKLSNDSRFENLNISKIMNSWINTEFYPVVKVTRNYTSGAVRLEQMPTNGFFGLNKTTLKTKRQWIPIKCTSESQLDFNTTFPSHWLKPELKRLNIDGFDKKDWIVCNIQQTGNYRVLYDNENWKRVAAYLNSENYVKISPINRAQILNDAYEFALNRHLDMNVFFDLLTYLRREDDYIPWYNADFLFMSLRHHLSNTKAYPSLDKLILMLVSPIADKIGYVNQPEDDPMTSWTRPIIRNLACHSNYEKCLNNATQVLQAYMNDEKFMVDVDDTQWWSMNSGLRRANKTIWSQMLDKYKKMPKKNFLGFLGFLDDQSILNHFLDLTFTNDSIIPDDHLLTVMEGMCIYPWKIEKRINFCLNFINDRFDEIKTRFANQTDTLVHIMDKLASDIRQKDQLDRLKNILSQEKVSYIRDRLGDRINKTENSIAGFDENANYFKPIIDAQIAKLC